MAHQTQAAQAIGIDLGGTHARMAVVAARGEIQQLIKVEVSDHRPQAVVDLLGDTLAKLPAEAAGLPIGLGMAGQILEGSGVVSNAPNFGWRDVPFAALLREKLGASVRLMNDLGAAAWGEASVGAAAGEPNAILVFVGSGVGSGLILGGRLHTGQQGVAGEFGHIKVIPGGRRCGCGELGCLEAYVSGKNLIARIAERLEGGFPSTLTKGQGAWELEQASLKGDALARELWEEVALLLSVAVANLCTVLNPRRLILGGGVLSGCPHLKESLKRGVFDYALRVSRVNLEVLDARLGDDAGVIGAALHALHPEEITAPAHGKPGRP